MASQPAPGGSHLGAALRQLASATIASLGTRRGLAVMYAVAALVRIVIAPRVGFYLDLEVFRAVTRRLSEVGISGYFSPDAGWVPAGPVMYAYLLRFVSIFGPDAGYLALKLPSLVSDLALAALSGALAARLAAARQIDPVKVRTTVTIAVLFGPAVLADGLIFGQNDVVPQVFVMGGFLLLLTGTKSLARDAASLACFAFALSFEPQSVIFGPVVAYAVLHRYVITRKSPGDRLRGGATIVALAVPGTLLAALSGLPFGLSPRELFSATLSATSIWSFTSSAAFNFWGMFYFFRKDYDFSILWMPSRAVGTVLFLAGLAFVLVRLHKSLARGRDFAFSVLWGSASVSLLGFTFLTRMHERYSFPAIVAVTPLIFLPAYRKYWWTISLFFTANLWWPYTWFNWQTQTSNPSIKIPGVLRLEPWYTWLFGDPNWTINTTQRRMFAAFGVALCMALVLRGLGWLHGTAPRTEPSAPAMRWRRVRMHLASTLEPGRRWPGRELGSQKVVARTAYGSLAMVCVWWLGALRDQLRAVPTLNDSTFHMQMVRWAESRLRTGRSSFDGWFPDLTLGSAFFHHYQSLPYNITAWLSRLLPSDADGTFRLLVWVLVGTWPVAVYASARLLDLRRGTAVIAAAVSLLLVSVTGYGFEIGSYTYGGYGVYTQMFGMWMLPLAWATTWRALHRDGNLAWAALTTALTVATHFMTGYLAMVSIAAVAVARPGRVVLLRALAIVASSVAAASWVLVPLLRDRHYSNVSEFYRNTFWYDSYGADPVVRWLVSGSLLDEGRLPVITVLAAIGALVCALRWKHDTRCRTLLLLAAASLTLFFGRATLGPLTNLMPGNDTLQMHRFIAGVHLAAIFLAAIGGAAVVLAVADSRVLARASQSNRHWLRLALPAAVIGVLLAPGAVERTNYALRDKGYIDNQFAAEAADGADLKVLLDLIKQRNDGRAYAGTRANWGTEYKIGSVPVHQQFAHHDIDAIGFTFRTMPSLSNDVESYFDEANLAQYEMFNVKYLVLPADRTPSVPARFVQSSGRHNLYEVQTTGYFDVVDRFGRVVADRSNLARQTTEFRASWLALNGVYPGVVFNDRTSGADTVSVGTGTRPGFVTRQSHDKNNGIFAADVSLERPGVVLLKSTFDPHWKVTVDGKERRVEFMAPSLVGVDVEAGNHRVSFEYQSFGAYPLLILLGMGTVLAVWFADRRRPGTQSAASVMQVESSARPVDGGAGGSKPRATSLEVVVPVYNEESTLDANATTLIHELQNQRAITWSVLIVDNGSVDRTLEVANRLAEQHRDNVRVLHLDEKGRGRALRAAWLQSQADVVAYTDVDLSTNLKHLPALVQPLLDGRAHVATGNRLMRGAKVQRQLKREVVSRVYNLLVKLHFPRRRVTDMQCGFKALTRQAVQQLVPMVRDQSWFFDTELLIRAEQTGYEVHQIPVEWIEDLDSRVNIARTAVDNMKGLWRVRTSPVRTSPARP